MRAYSLDLRQRIVEAYQRGEGSQAQLAQRFAVSDSFIEKLLHRLRTTGSIAPAAHSGRPRSVAPTEEPLLCALIEQDNDATDAEIAVRFHEDTGRTVSLRTINHMWRRLQITRKKDAQGQRAIAGGHRGRASGLFAGAAGTEGREPGLR